MDNDFNTNDIRTSLNKICSSSQFVKSSRYIQLLTFLTEEALKGNHLKEQIIGAELFKKNYDAIKDDGKVRVYMFNLRKKLSEYYKKEGKEDAILFELKKGKYDISFKNKINNNEEENQQIVKKSKVLSNRNKISIALILIGSLFSIFYFDLFSNDGKYCWQPFLSKNATNTIILADQVVMHKINGVTGELYTHKEINSAEDFINFTKKKRKDSLALSSYTFFTKAIPYSLLELSKFFTKHNSDLTPQKESEFKYDIIKRGNIIYLGQPKTMSLSKEIFLKNSRIFSYDEFFSSKKDGETITYKPKYGDNIRMEYAMVSYTILENGNSALYFASNHDIGVMATVSYFTNLDKLKELYQKLPTKKSHFNALFKVEGLNRTDVNCELVALEIIGE